MYLNQQQFIQYKNQSLPIFHNKNISKYQSTMIDQLMNQQNQSFIENSKNSSQLKEQDFLICLNPHCKIFNKVFSITQKSTHLRCSQWIISKKEVLSNSLKTIQSQSSQNIELKSQKNDKACDKIKNLEVDFLKNPIQSSKQMNKLKQKLVKKYLQQIFQLSLKNILKIFQQRLINQLKQTLDQINDIINAGSQVWNDIYYLLKQFQKQKLNSEQGLKNKTFQYKLQILQKFGKIAFINQSKIQKRLARSLNEIDNIFQGFLFRQKNQQIQQRKTQIYSYKEVTAFVQDQQEGVINKLQKLSSIFRAPQPQFELSETINYFDSPKNISPQNVIIIDQQDQNKDSNHQIKCSSKCWICQKKINVFPSLTLNTKAKKNLCAQKLLFHLFENHSSVIQYQYITKILKKTKYKISYQLFLFEISNLDLLYNGRFKNKFIVIDRQNAGKFQVSPNQLQQFYVIQVVSKANQNLAKGKYMIAESIGKDASDLLSVLMMYQMGKIQDCQIYLITNDHYGKTLKQILLPLGIDILCHGLQFNDYRMPNKSGNRITKN